MGVDSESGDLPRTRDGFRHRGRETTQLEAYFLLSFTGIVGSRVQRRAAARGAS